jgi:hypothetical protein
MSDFKKPCDDDRFRHLALRDGRIVVTEITPDVRHVARCARAIREEREKRESAAGETP